MTMLSIEPQPRDERWTRIAGHAPVLATTCQDYVAQIAVTARPSTTKAVDSALRIFSEWLIDHDPTVIALRQIERRHIEVFKLWLATRENQRGEPLKKSTIHLRLSMLRVVFERLIEWDHPDTPTRNPIMWTDLPKLDEPLPKFLDDEQAAKFMAAAVRLDPQRRLVVEMLARTGLRVTEFCELTDDAIVKMNETHWLRVPVGKLHTDRYVPLHPSLIELHRDWLDWNGPNTTGRLISNKGRPLNRDVVTRIVKRCARIAGIGHVHPHQLRHTLATQSINNGMSLEAVSAMLGHRSMRTPERTTRSAPWRSIVFLASLTRHLCTGCGRPPRHDGYPRTTTDVLPASGTRGEAALLCITSAKTPSETKPTTTDRRIELRCGRCTTRIMPRTATDSSGRAPPVERGIT